MDEPAPVIRVPTAGLVVLIGPAGAGKSTFAKRHFRSTEIVSSDACRALVSDRAHNQAASADAFRLLHEIVALRLQRRRLAVVDATNVEPLDRRPSLQLAAGRGLPAVAVVFDLDLDLCAARDGAREEGRVGGRAIRRQWESMLLGLPGLAAEPAVAAVHVLRTPAEVAGAVLKRVRPESLTAPATPASAGVPRR